MQKYKLIILLLLLCGLKGYSQDTAIYQVVLIEMKRRFEDRTFVMIDSLGMVKSEKNKIGEQLDVQSFSMAISKFFNSVAAEKFPANNNLNRKAREPNGAEKCLNIYLIRMSDFNSDSGYKNKTYYHYVACQPLDGYDLQKYELFKFLNSENRTVISRMME